LRRSITSGSSKSKMALEFSNITVGIRPPLLRAENESSVNISSLELIYIDDQTYS
jgi:hypothetical protein